MKWFENLNELSYYNPIKGVPCFCETLIYPSDLTLQGDFTKGSGGYTLEVQILSPDGLTVYANNATANSYFEYYFANNQYTGKHFFNLRLKSFVPVMCTKVCYIIQVIVYDGGVVKFAKYTDRYCQSSCCDLARDITISQDLIVDGGNAGAGTVTASENPKVSECGDTIITLRTKYDCYDKFTGLYYGTPSATLSGSASFAFENITNFKGRIVQRPRDIVREYSYNCRLQRVESQIPYLLEGFEYFPAWKMNEIEAQLHSTEIYVDNERYEFNGGTAFRQLNPCFELFKLEAELSDCVQRQVFGCDATCEAPTNFDGAMMMYVVPSNYQGGSFYNESKEEVAGDLAGLMLYMRNLEGIIELNEIDIDELDCDLHGAFSISGTGYIPTFFYFDGTANGNRVYGAVHESVEDLCELYGNGCPAPDMGSPVITEDECPVPDMGSPVITDMTASDIPLASFDTDDWVVVTSPSDSPWLPASSASLYDGQVLLSLYVYNLNHVEDPEAEGEPVVISNEVIAVIGATGRPEVERYLDSTNSNMPENMAITIDTNGLIRFLGTVTATDADSSIIELTEIRYNIYGT